MTKVLAVLGAWRMMRALARLVAIVMIAGLALGYVSLGGHHHPPLVPVRHALAPVARQLKTTLEHEIKP